MRFRNFAPHVEELAAQCAGDLWSTESFTITSTTGGGGTGAVRVTMDGSGLPAWAKPRQPRADAGMHAGHEKIAFDMGHGLGLPISPVILSREGAAKGLPPVVAISYEALGQQRRWSEIEPQMTAEQQLQQKQILTAMRIFHAWINDQDHNSRDANAAAERDGTGVVRASYFDHSNGLTMGWPFPAPPGARDWGAWPGDFANPDHAAAMEILSRIEHFALEEIRRIIQRLPDGCLSTSTRDALVTGLDGRRRDLRRILNL